MTSLHKELTDAVKSENVPLDTALRAVTSNPARILKLTKKGQLCVGSDADLLLLNAQTLAINSVMAMGQWCMRDGTTIRKGTFE
jgi:beta-aspartyl-dipeptidase (metallo-type)